MKLIDGPPIPLKDIQSILNSSIPFGDKKNPDEVEQCQTMLATLSEEDFEIAAQSSYAYWLASLSDQPPTPEQRLRMATREARRFLFGNAYEKAINEFYESIKYRKERNVFVLRALFTEGIKFESDEESEQAETFRSLILPDIEKQSAFVRGKDKEGLAIMTIKARTEIATEDEAFINTQLYVMERALATTEALSMGKKEQIMVVLDFGDFTSSLAPPWNAIKAVVSILQHCYSCRLKRLLIIDPPYWMRATYAFLKPFLELDTSEKFVMISGDEEKMTIFSEFIDDDQAMPFMLPNGKLTKSVDLERFLEDVPFHCLYDDPTLV